MERTIIVTGSRFAEAVDRHVKVIYETLVEEAEPVLRITLVHGWANGVDRIADGIGRSLGWRVLPYPAQWKRPDGSIDMAAGVLRNQRMVDEHPDAYVVVAFPLAGQRNKGTNDMIARARKAGLRVREVVLPKVRSR